MPLISSDTACEPRGWEGETHVIWWAAHELPRAQPTRVRTAARRGELVAPVRAVPLAVAQPAPRHTGVGALAAEHVGRTGDGTWNPKERCMKVIHCVSAGKGLALTFPTERREAGKCCWQGRDCLESSNSVLLLQMFTRVPLKMHSVRTSVRSSKATWLKIMRVFSL